MSRFAEIAARYEAELLHSITPFWIKHAVDRVNGGFWNNLDRRGKCFDPAKSSPMQWRNVWSFAMLYNCVRAEAEYLELAEHGYAFCRGLRRPDGTFPILVDARGGELYGGKPHFGMMTLAYAACATAELFRATGREELRAESQAYFTAYRDGIRESEQPSSSSKFPPMRHRGNYMHLCHVCRTMLVCECEFDGQVAAALDMTFEILPTFRNAELGRWLENQTPQGGFDFDHSMGRMVLPGHDFETMWFLAQGAEWAGRDDILQRIPEWTLEMFEYATDPVYGGVYGSLDALECPDMDGMAIPKRWWVHNEALLAAAFAYRIGRDPQLLEHFNAVDAWCWKHFRDAEYGEWYGNVNPDGQAYRPVKGSYMKTFYHLPRALYNCMEVFRDLDAEESVGRR